MSTNAQYAAIGRIGAVRFSTANTNRDGTGALAVLAAATCKKGESSRVDRATFTATGTTTAGMLRLFVTKGVPGEAIASISFSTTTATLMTSAAHGRKTGDRLTVMGALPDEYNVTDVTLTVLSPTSFTYVMASAPTMNALTLGNYSATTATAESRLVGELPVTAFVPTGTQQAFNTWKTSTAFMDAGLFPLILPAGYSLRVSTHNAESFDGVAQIGDTA